MQQQETTTSRTEQAQLDALVSKVFGDFRKFCALLTIRLKEGGEAPFRYATWHQEQKQFQIARTGRDIVLKPRQVGFSTLELARDLLRDLRRRHAQLAAAGQRADLIAQALAGADRPTHLVVLDATWAHARRLYRDNPWLARLAHYRLAVTDPFAVLRPPE